MFCTVHTDIIAVGIVPQSFSLCDSMQRMQVRTDLLLLHLKPHPAPWYGSSVVH